MRAAVDGVDVVRERVDLLGKAVVVLQRDLDDGRVVESPLDVHGLRMQVLVRPIQVAHEADDPAIEVVVLLGPSPFVVEREPEALVQIRGLA